MSKRVSGSMRTRQSLCDLIEGLLSSPDGRAELVPPPTATRLSSPAGTATGDGQPRRPRDLRTAPVAMTSTRLAVTRDLAASPAWRRRRGAPPGARCTSPP